MSLVNLSFNYLRVKFDSKIMIILMCLCRGGGLDIEAAGSDEGPLCTHPQCRGALSGFLLKPGVSSQEN